MKLYFIFLTILFSNFIEARVLYFTEHTIINLNTTNPALEANLFISNPSANSQRVCYPEILFFNYSVQSSNNPSDTFGNSNNSAFTQLYTSRILPAQPIADVTAGARITATCAIINSNQTLNLIFIISPILQNVFTAFQYTKFLDERSGPSNYQSIPAASFGGGGDFMGYVFFKGFLNVTDVNPANPGFVTISGNILKPNSIGGLNSVNTYEFNLNNGKPF